MKKNTFLGILLSITFCTSIAQTIIIDRSINDDLTINSSKGTDEKLFVAADYFELNEETAIGEIDVPGSLVRGIRYLGNLEIGFNIYIYEDNNGVPAGNPTQPGTGIVELSDINPAYYSKYENGEIFKNRTDFNQIQVTAANGGEQVILPAGIYWVSFFLTIEGAPDGEGLWAWIGSTTANPPPQIQPVFIDPYNIYGGGWTNWTNISIILGGNYPSCAWTMRSENIILDMEDNVLSKITIHPNPTRDIVNVSIPQTIEIYRSSIIDITGKRINDVRLDNGLLDISLLSKGVYLLRIETSEGNLIKKIIKN